MLLTGSARKYLLLPCINEVTDKNMRLDGLVKCAGRLFATVENNALLQLS